MDLSRDRARRTGGSGAGCTRRRCIAPTPPSRSEPNSRSRPTLAADGITEFLERIAIQAGSDGAALPLEAGNTLHLHATDPGLGEAGEWTINVSGDGIAWSHEHGKGSVALRGRRHRAVAGDGAADARVAETGIEIFGDDSVWQNWLERTPL